MICLRSLLVGLLLATTPVIAAPERGAVVDDFAYGYTLNTTDGAAVYAITLPVDVYQHMQRNDFGDIRVFNSQGEAVPHALLPPDRTEEIPTRVKLPVFPVRSSPIMDNNLMSVRIKRDIHGTIIDVRNDLPQVKDLPVSAYIIDTSKLTIPIKKLLVQWNKTDGLVTAVTVAASEDLNYWRVLKPSATLAELVQGGERLKRDTIDMPIQRSKYLRLSFSQTNTPITISGIEAELATKSQGPVPVWITLEGKAENDKDGNKQFFFDTDGRYPIDRLNVVFNDQNSMARVKIYSRNSDKDEWRLRTGNLFYRVNRDGGAPEFRNDPIYVGRTFERYWRLDLDAEASSLQNPKLEMGWVPDQVTFLARGAGPYQLVFGSATVLKAEQPVGTLLNTLNRDQQSVRTSGATLGERMVLGGEDRLRGGPQSIQWKRILLWAVLLGGVVLLAAMAMGLWRQLGQAKGGNDS